MGPDTQGLPLGLVVSRTAGIVRRNLVAVGGVALVASVPGVFAIQYALALVGDDGKGAAFAASLVQLVIGMVLGAAATGAITYIAAADQAGQRAGVCPAFGAALRVMLPLLGLGLVMGLGVGLGLMALMVPGLMLAMSWSVAASARVVECPTLGSSLARSTALTSGNRWRLFVIAVLVVVLSVLLEGGLTLLADTLDGGVVLTDVMLVVSDTVTTAIDSTGSAVCYLELRRMREGMAGSEAASVFT